MMYRLLKVISAVGIAAIMLSLCSCKKVVANAVETEATTTTASAADNFYDHVKLLGRTYISDGIIWCALSGTGAAFDATGSKLNITINGCASALDPGNENNFARVAVFVNGVSKVDTQISGASTTINVDLPDGDKPSEVRVVKLSEAMSSVIGISNITCDGEITPLPQNKFNIEFIGDSITCGYGIDDPDKDHHFTTAKENITETYGYKTAMDLNADYSIVAYSGYGVISGNTTNDKIAADRVVPRVYTRIAGATDLVDGKALATVNWSFSPEPNLIVINLGTNDDSYCNGNFDREAAFVKGYKEFLTKVRGKNPDARILCTLGVMGDRLYPSVQKAVEEYSADSKDTNVSCLKFDIQQPSDGYCADWHPSEATNEKMAQKLEAWITSNMGIKPVKK